MTQLPFYYNDGGRSQYFKAKNVGDCVIRAAAIASRKDYKEVYNLAHKLAGYSPREGLKNEDCKKLMIALGFKWMPCMKIGTGCKVHLRAGEIPMKGRIVVSLSKHYCAVIDGVINDSYDCSRDGNRCVYGYWEYIA